MILNHLRQSPRDWDDAIPSLCPDCSATLIPRRGRVVVWHWAHKSAGGVGDGCSAAETTWHLLWKDTYHGFPGWEIEVPVTVGQKAYRLDAANLRTGRVREFVHSLDERYILKHLALKGSHFDVLWIFDGAEFAAARQRTIRRGGIKHLLKPKARWLHGKIGGLVHYDRLLWREWKSDCWYPVESSVTTRLIRLFEDNETRARTGQRADPNGDVLRGRTPEPFFGKAFLMPRITYDDQKSPEQLFGVPTGSYLAKFVGTEDKPAFTGPSRYGTARTNEPRLAWHFEVTEGEHRGKRFTQGSGSIPSGPKATFTKMLKGLLGRLPVKGEDIDTDAYIGRLYRVEVEVNPESDSGNFHIAYMSPHQGGAPAPRAAAPPPAPPAAPNRPAPPAPPPPAPPIPAASRPEPQCWFFLQGQDAPVEMTATAFRAEVAAGRVKPDEVQWMPPDRSGGWQPVVGSWLVGDDSPPF
jgi:hypothetical protein